MDTKNLADLYKLPPVPWSKALDALEHPGPQDTWFLATTRADGSPHMAGVGAMWDGDRVYIVCGDQTAKIRNLQNNPNCAIGVSLKGIDLTFEGPVERITDEATLQRLAKRYNDSGWPARVEDGAFTYDYSAPSAGPPPWNLYAITPKVVYGVLSDEPGGATRWTPEG